MAEQTNAAPGGEAYGQTLELLGALGAFAVSQLVRRPLPLLPALGEHRLAVVHNGLALVEDAEGRFEREHETVLARPEVLLVANPCLATLAHRVGALYARHYWSDAGSQ